MTDALLDTNILIALVSPREKTPALDGFDVMVSTLSWSELERGVAASKTVPVRVRRQNECRDLYAKIGDGIPYDQACVRAHRRVLDQIVTSGRDPRARLVDTMIAATAVANDLLLITRNVADFEVLDGLLDVVER